MKHLKYLFLSLLLSLLVGAVSLANTPPEVTTYFELSIPKEIRMHSPEGREIDFYMTNVPGIEMISEGHYVVYNLSFEDAGYYFASNETENEAVDIISFDHKLKEEFIFSIDHLDAGEKININNYDLISVQGSDGFEKEYHPIKTREHPEYEFKPIVTKGEQPGMLGSLFRRGDMRVIYIFFIFIILLIGFHSFLKRRRSKLK